MNDKSQESFVNFIYCIEQRMVRIEKQAGAELGQAQVRLS